MLERSRTRLYKGKYMIALYDVELTTNRELECLVVVDNIRGLLNYFSISITTKEITRMKDKIYRSLHSTKKDHRKLILVNGEAFKISLIPERSKK